MVHHHERVLYRGAGGTGFFRWDSDTPARNTDMENIFDVGWESTVVAGSGSLVGIRRIRVACKWKHYVENWKSLLWRGLNVLGSFKAVIGAATKGWYIQRVWRITNEGELLWSCCDHRPSQAFGTDVLCRYSSWWNWTPRRERLRFQTWRDDAIWWFALLAFRRFDFTKSFCRPWSVSCGHAGCFRISQVFPAQNTTSSQ